MPILDDLRDSSEWIAKALNSSGYRADFSLRSLPELNKFFEDQAPDGQVAPDGLLAEDQFSRVFAIGAYTGEVIRRFGGGYWRTDDRDPKGHLNVELVRSDGGICWPVQRAFKRFQNGQEDSLYAYGMVLLGVSPRQLLKDRVVRFVLRTLRALGFIQS